jgi:hypothetical protein
MIAFSAPTFRPRLARLVIPLKMCPGVNARTVQRSANPVDKLASHTAAVSNRQTLNQKILNFSTVCTGPCTLGDIDKNPIYSLGGIVRNWLEIFCFR